jgi:AraC-like DNA-binding protein
MPPTTDNSFRPGAAWVERQVPRSLAKRSAQLSPKIWRVVTYLDQCYAQRITLNQAATVVDLHPDYLCRRFRRETGVRFHEYLTTLRLQRATTLLVTSTQSIKAIGYEVGFGTPEVFSKAFKRWMGCSPTTYRLHNLLPYGDLAMVRRRTTPENRHSDLADRLADWWEDFPERS